MKVPDAGQRGRGLGRSFPVFRGRAKRPPAEIGLFSFVLAARGVTKLTTEDPVGLSVSDIIYDVMTPAQLIRSTRERAGLSQRQLALRAGSTQAAVSRLERGIVSPTFDTVHQLLLAMGEEPVLSAQRLPTDWDPVHMASTLGRAPSERLALACSWNRLALRLAAAGRLARKHG
jgi:transcriptional regulator with XRE-family HTH domain